MRSRRLAEQQIWDPCTLSTAVVRQGPSSEQTAFGRVGNLDHGPGVEMRCTLPCKPTGWPAANMGWEGAGDEGGGT